ncbi:transcriptional regulator, AraC family [Insolitispirillum peregrinum]|uniref:Transcriptional regulator, AraC family n=2 Tax=Insolitispirillum peregrinum TaxID=80876 RepID=A0A1N7P9C0_9PROT|nr:transcriptional regulator, AraC family [Insolitispirillum peregrinum]
MPGCGRLNREDNKNYLQMNAGRTILSTMDDHSRQISLYSPRQHHDLASQCGYRYRDLQIDGRAPQADEAQAMMQGKTVAAPVQPGLTLMLSDITQFHDFSAEAEMASGLLVGVSLAGVSDGMVEGIGAVHTPAGEGLSLNMGRPLLFSGQQRKGLHYTTASVYATADWLEQHGLLVTADFAGTGRVAARNWVPSAELRHHLSHLVHGAAGGVFERLTQEALSLELVRQGVTPFLDGDPTVGSLAPADRARMHRVRDALVAAPGADHRLGDLARDAGVSVTVLKEKYRLAFGETVFETLRAVRLDLGRRLLEQGMPLAQVAAAVGYAHAANFVTAYRRRFGVSPRRHLQQGL